MDGLGGLVLTPTRELAQQIFEELRKIGRQHDMSAGLLIGERQGLVPDCCWLLHAGTRKVWCCCHASQLVIHVWRSGSGT